MTRIVLQGLTPATNYAIQLRAKGLNGVSDWSRIFNLTTNQDTIAPNTPGSVSGSMSGTAFVLTWAAVTLSSDGSNAYDLDTYEVKVTSSGSGNVGNYKIKGLRFEFSFEMNRALFGTPQANVQMAVRAVDVVGNASAYSSTVNQTNAAPAPVTSLVLAPVADALNISWVGVADTDLDHYEVHIGTASGFTTSGATLVWQGLGTSTVYKTSAYATTFYTKVYAVDVFGTLSTVVQAGPQSPISPFVIDLTAPAVPAGLTTSLSTTVDQKTTATVSWTAVANPTNDLQGYIVRYKASADSDYDYVNVDSGVTSVKILVTKPYVNYDFAVRAYDFYANYSAWSSTSTATGATNSAPGTPTGMVLSPGIQSVIVQWTENTELDVINGAGGYEVQIDTVNTFSSGNLKTIRNSGTVVSFTGLTSNTIYFVRMRAVDSLGAVSSYNTTLSTTTGVVTNSDVVVGTLSGDRITAATLSGDRVIANTLDANTLKANTVVAQNLGVNSTLTMGDASNNGIIKSFGYVASTTGWQISKTGFEVNQGTIAAAALLIQDSDNIMPPDMADFEYRSSYYTPSGAWATFQMTASILSTTPKFNSQCMTTFWGAVASNPAFYTSTSSTNYNINVEASTNYILSAYVRNRGGVTTVVQGNVKLSNATVLQAFTVTPTAGSSTWVRVSGVVTVPAGITSVLVFFDSPTFTNLAGFDLDGIQLEKQNTGATTPSPWKPPGVTRIDGGIIRTGSILSSATVVVNSVSQPSWSINMAGAAQFGDVSVRGKILVGGAGADPDAGQSFISSGNYVAGTTGWKVDSAGAAEFQSATVRGTINATGGTFSGTITASGTISGGTISGASFQGGAIDTPAFGSIGVSAPGGMHADANGLFVTADSTTNLLLDPSFEGASILTGDVLTGTGTAVAISRGPAFIDFTASNTDQVPYQGKSTLKVSSTGTGNGFVDIVLGTGTALGLTPGATYSLSVHVAAGLITEAAFFGNLYHNLANFGLVEKTTGAVITQRSTGISGYVTLEGVAGITSGAISSVVSLANSGWSYRWYVNFTLSAGAAASSTYYLRLPAPCTSIGGTDATHALFYDAAQLENKTYMTRYADGDQDNCAWTGTRNASSSTRGAGIFNLWAPSFGDARISGRLTTTRLDSKKIKIGSGPIHGSNQIIVYKTATVSCATGTFVDMVFDSAPTDRNQQDDGIIYINNKEFVAPFAGIYMLHTTVTWTANSTGARIMRHLYGAVGSETNEYARDTNTFGTNTQISHLVSTIFMAAGNAIKCQVWQSSGSTITTAANGVSSPTFATFTYLGGI